MLMPEFRQVLLHQIFVNDKLISLTNNIKQVKDSNKRMNLLYDELENINHEASFGHQFTFPLDPRQTVEKFQTKDCGNFYYVSDS